MAKATNNPVIDATIAQVTASDTVIDSATVLIGGIAKMVADAVTAALAGGATAAQLQPVTDVVTVLKAKSDALAAAVAANTPAAP
jgi:hypothetical protein